MNVAVSGPIAAAMENPFTVDDKATVRTVTAADVDLSVSTAVVDRSRDVGTVQTFTTVNENGADDQVIAMAASPSPVVAAGMINRTIVALWLVTLLSITVPVMALPPAGVSVIADRVRGLFVTTVTRTISSSDAVFAPRGTLGIATLIACVGDCHAPRHVGTG